MPQQFDNPANVEVHRRTTAQEILRDFGDSPPDAIITGVGTGGHITACAEVLKPQWPNLKVFAVEPALVAGALRRRAGAAPDPGHRRRLHPGDHGHQSARRRDSRSIQPTPRRWRGGPRARKACSSASRRARRWPAIDQKIPELGDRPRVLGFNYDTGERYLSVPTSFPKRLKTRANRTPFASALTPARLNSRVKARWLRRIRGPPVGENQCAGRDSPRPSR